MKTLNKLYPHALVILGFVLVSLIYFYPVLQGKKIYQSDIVQYTGMAKEQNDFRAEEHVEPFWTNSAFGGMPTYQLGAKYPNDFIGTLDDALRFLPRPADYLFLYFLGFYALLFVLKTDPLKAFFGALAFGFSTYLIVILGVGHNAKAHAIAYMPMVIAGVILVFRRKYIWGGFLTMIAVALELNANHFQMTYYLLFLLLIIGIYYSYKLIKDKEFTDLSRIIGVFAIALILALGVNATNLLATKEYADFSMRGKSELTFNPDGSKNTENASMSKEYITQYSYGIAESFNLIAPRLFGGGNSESLGKDSEMVKFLQQQQVGEGQYISQEQAEKYAADGMPTYWGDQPIVAAPAYIGAIVFFLAVLGLYHDKRKIKYAFLAGAVFSLLLSWGKNFSTLTDFFIDCVPMYDKFRAVSSIQVLLELCIPVIAIMGLQSFFDSESEKKWDSLWKAAATSLGLIAVLFLSKGLFDFSGEGDSMILNNYGPEFMSALKADRKTLFSADLLRSGFFISVAFLILWMYIKNKVAAKWAIVLVGLFMVTDLFFVAKNYVDKEDFVSASEVDSPFQMTPADELIQKDKSIFRVYELQGRLQARTSYFHKSVGGYSAVRPRRFDQLFDYQIDRGLIDLGKNIDPQTFMMTKSNSVLDALNVKYIILEVKDGQMVPITNPFANGNAWFVNELKTVNSADEEMKALDNLDTKNVAVINKKDFPNEVKNSAFAKDTTAKITITKYKPNTIVYNSSNSNSGFAVFSEMYYKNGWIATIDGKEATILKVDYVLRGLQIPAGKHTIEFKFEPQVIKTGGRIALFTTIAILLLAIGMIYLKREKLRI
ncbi:MAG: YfhO family protein [Bacteroidota bacterium]